ncbi:MAG TPA: hypothetical protein VFM39_07795 [bacterium]|nr:hypothetical protein [bacterium]
MLVILADNRILYFRRDRETFEFLSHFYPAPTLLDGQTWPMEVREGLRTVPGQSSEVPIARSG